jgi:hypothetical protein
MSGGEELVWFTMADKQGRSIDEVQESTTSSDFVRWIAFYNLQHNTPDRDTYYLMQIAAEIRRIAEGFAEKPRAVSIDDMRIGFNTIEDGEVVSWARKPVQETQEPTVDPTSDELIVCSYTDPAELDQERIRMLSEHNNEAFMYMFGVLADSRVRTDA